MWNQKNTRKINKQNKQNHLIENKVIIAKREEVGGGGKKYRDEKKNEFSMSDMFFSASLTTYMSNSYPKQGLILIYQ